jgi:hypothetical protein
MEYWNTGMMDERKNGTMEYWSNGILGLDKNSNVCSSSIDVPNIPFFHHSTIPVFYYSSIP